jgi:hypothetical protein
LNCRNAAAAVDMAARKLARTWPTWMPWKLTETSRTTGIAALLTTIALVPRRAARLFHCALRVQESIAVERGDCGLAGPGLRRRAGEDAREGGEGDGL